MKFTKFQVAESLSSLPAFQNQKSKKKNPPPTVKPNEDPANLKWPRPEEEFLGDDGWRICSVVSFDDARNMIKAQLLSIFTQAKG